MHTHIHICILTYKVRKLNVTKKSHVQENGNSYTIYEKIKEQSSKIQTYIYINLKGTNYLH